MKHFRKALIAGAVGMSLTGTVNAQVLYDPDGVPGGAAPRLVNLFDWKPGNIIFTDVTPIGVAAETSKAGAKIFAQAILGTVSGTGNSFDYSGVGSQLTYQLIVDVTYSAGGAGQTIVKAGPSLGTLNIYYNSSIIANETTGCGYGALQDAAYCLAAGTATPSTLIYTGAVKLKGSATLTDNTIVDGTPILSLDPGGANADVDEGITSNSLSTNSLSLDVDTILANPAFFPVRYHVFAHRSGARRDGRQSTVPPDGEPVRPGRRLPDQPHRSALRPRGIQSRSRRRVARCGLRPRSDQQYGHRLVRWGYRSEQW